jgi:ABC-type transport system involved in cytochrome bd biosynthesis fused ATPase/permease subunit
MLQIAELRRADAKRARVKVVNWLPPKVTAADQDDGLLSVAGPLMVGAYAVAMGIVALTFLASAEALFAISICVGFAVMFFTLPLLMLRIRAHRDRRWQKTSRHELKSEVEIYTGTIGRTEAIAQMVIIPLAVAVAFSSFAIIWTLVRL